MIDDPVDEWPCLIDMHNQWHVKVETYPGVSLTFEDIRAIMIPVMDYFKESSYA